MKILIACEESQIVCKAFRKKGHEAYSCDIQECSGEHPKWHIQGDVLPLLKEEWDLIIAHPPCTYLANSGVCWLHRDKTRWQKMREGAEFFKKFIEYGSTGKAIAIENPVMHKYAKEIIVAPYCQIIQPWQFGHTESKATCLWLFNLPALKETNNVKEEMLKLSQRERNRLHYLPPSVDRQKIRSKTFQGIANAMANQWG